MRPFASSAAASRFEFGEFEIGVLRDLDEFVREPARLADARFARVLPFEAPQNAEQIEAPRLGLQAPSGRSQEAPQAQTRRPAHHLAPLDGADDRLGEVVDRDIFGEEAVEDRAEQKSARAFERPAFQDDA